MIKGNNMLRIKDSSSEKYIEMNDEKISIYNCGPTVYNDVHVGNVRPLITFDVLYRYLKKQNKPVIYVHNITDVDDKIINRSIELHQSELELADRYYHEYLKIIDSLNVLRMDHLPKVSDNIDGIIDFVGKLIKAKHAYVVDGDVYFDIKSIDNYGSVSHQKIDMLLEGVRKDVDEKKKFALDFAL
jgi:cysteinyl-tRNA synthetase